MEGRGGRGRGRARGGGGGGGGGRGGGGGGGGRGGGSGGGGGGGRGGGGGGRGSGSGGGRGSGGGGSGRGGGGGGGRGGGGGGRGSGGGGGGSGRGGGGGGGSGGRGGGSGGRGGRGGGGGGGGDHGWRGRGTGRGWGQPTQPLRPSNPVQQPSSNPVEPPVVPSPVQQPPPPTIAPATAATVESPTSSHHVGETGVKRTPMRKPDDGGTNAVNRVPLLVNHFLVNFNSDRHILHYDVDIELEASPEKGRPEKKISKSTRHMIKKKLCSNNPSKFPPSSIAYDGEKNIFSAVELPTGNFTVELGDVKVCSFIVTIKLVKQLEFQKLSDYFSGNLPYVSRDILQGMDVVMKENPVRSMISVGRRFYLKEIEGQSSGHRDLGTGIMASRGFEHSLKPTAQGLSLCLDHSSSPFFGSILVTEFLEKHIKGFTLPEFNRYRSRVEAALKGLKVEVIHRTTQKIFIVAGLTSQDTGKLSFLEDDPKGKGPPQQVKLVDFFKRKYGMDIEHKNIPCLDVGKNNRQIYVPMEFCKLVGGQRCRKEIVDKDDGAQKLMKNELTPKPSTRNERIGAMVEAKDGPCGGGIIDSFGIIVNNNMTQVEGRVIKPPVLKLQDRPITVDDKCRWTLSGRKVAKAIRVQHWAVVDFMGIARQQSAHQFIRKFILRCGDLGIQMRNPDIHETASMDDFRYSSKLRKLLEKVNPRRELQIIVCVMARRDTGYAYLKWFSETTMGVITQCCLYTHTNTPKDQYLANLALKLNAKLGGSNVELIERLFPLEGKGHVMFIGADVNHPDSPNTKIPSIAAVVATVNWPAANRYATRIRPQPHRQEIIQNFGAMCLELVKAYVQENKVKPEKIVVFRDGVSEGQFDKVLNQELHDLKTALEEGAKYCPTITLILAQKRHLTRMFLMKNNILPKQSSSDADANVPPGTVVDKKVVHPSEFDFYLCSHHGQLGTSKPTHYQVLHDDHKFSSDQIQKLTFNLCFTFARCTKSISLVPPVYYADLAAYRGRLYCDAMAWAGDSAATPSSSSAAAASASPSSSAAAASPSSSSAAAGDRLNDVASYRLARALENMMFFI